MIVLGKIQALMESVADLCLTCLICLPIFGVENGQKVLHVYCMEKNQADCARQKKDSDNCA